MMKTKYFIINDDCCIGYLYEYEGERDVLVINGSINPDKDVIIYDGIFSKAIEEIDIKKWLLSMIPEEK